MSQTRLSNYGAQTSVDLSVLTPAERRAYVAIRLNGSGVREHSRATDRSPGTVGNLLRRAERKMGVRKQ